jgi:hypothetical protein
MSYDLIAKYPPPRHVISQSLLAYVIAVIVKRNPRRRKKTESEGDGDGDGDGGVEYPLDIWFLISEYILPENVSTFARICKSASHVVSTAKFWFHLYRRY